MDLSVSVLTLLRNDLFHLNLEVPHLVEGLPNWREVDGVKLLIHWLRHLPAPVG